MSPRAIPTTGHVIALPTGRLRRPAEAQILPVAAGVSALAFDLGAAAPLSGRLTGEIDGAPARGPLVSTRLALRSGGTRHVLLVGEGAGALLDRRILLSLGGRLAAAIEPDWLQSPLADPATLIEGLADEGRRRLLKLFMTTGASLFGADAGAGADAAADFARAAEGLLTLLGLRSLPPAGACRLGAAALVLSYVVAPGFDPATLGELVLLTRGRARRLGGCKAVVERRGKAALLHLGLPRPVPADAALVATGTAALRLEGPGPRTRTQPLGRWLAGRDPATRGWAQDLVEAAAATDPAAAALAHEMRWLAGAPPALTVAHLSGTPRGVLYAVRLADPHGLVRGLAVERGGAVAEVPFANRPGAASVGYVPLPRASRLDDTVRLRLIFHSGQGEAVHAGPLAAFDGAMPALAGVEDAAAVARARLDRARSPATGWTETFGTMPRRTRLAVVTPLGADPDMIRARAALLAAEVGRTGVVVVVSMADGPAVEAVRAAIAQTVAVHGLPHRLVVTGPDADPATRLIAALRPIGAAATLLLGAEVLPAQGAGLAGGLRRLPARRMAFGALTDHEGQEAAAGAAACVALAPVAVDAIVALGAAYPEPDVLVAEAARRLGVRPRPGRAGGFVRFAATGGDRTPADAAADACALALMAEG